MIHETMLLLQRLMIPDSNVFGKLVHDSNVRPVDHFKWWVYLQPLGQLGHGHRVPTHPQFKEPQFMNVRIDGLFSVYLTEKLPGSSRKVQRVRG